MPEINPVTKDQLFEKKIAENTGSDYNAGDISDVVPVTKDQALLKEIALNTAEQSGDIIELKGKVADNTSAIEAITENGCCNVLDLSDPSIVSDGVTFTVNLDGSVTANGTAVANSFIVFKNAATARDMVVVGASDGVHIIAQPYGHNWEEVDEGIIHGINQNGFALQVDAGVTVDNVTVYPMLYDARLNPTGYVPYAMTNRELTERVSNSYTSVMCDGVKTTQQVLNELYSLVDRSRVSAKTRIAYVYDNSTLWFMSLSALTPNRFRFDGIADADNSTVVAYHIQLSETVGDCAHIEDNITSNAIQPSDKSLLVQPTVYEYRVYY